MLRIPQAAFIPELSVGFIIQHRQKKIKYLCEGKTAFECVRSKGDKINTALVGAHAAGTKRAQKALGPDQIRPTAKKPPASPRQTPKKSKPAGDFRRTPDIFRKAVVYCFFAVIGVSGAEISNAAFQRACSRTLLI